MNTIFGRNAALAVLSSAKREIFEIICLNSKFEEYSEYIPESLKKKTRVVKNDILQKITKETDKHQGICIIAGELPTKSFSEILSSVENKDCANIFILDSINDPQNLGAILRSSYCFGVDAVLISKQNSCKITNAVTRASAGYSEMIDIHYCSNITNSLREFQKNDFFSTSLEVGKNSEKKIELRDFIQSHKKRIFIFGSEGVGVSQLVSKTSDYNTLLPMKEGVDSLNLSNTVAIVGWECFSV